MTTEQPTREPTKSKWWQKISLATVYFFVAGVILLVFTGWAITERSDTAAASLALLAGGAFVVAPFAPNIEGTLKLGWLEVPIRKQVIEAIAKAKPRELEAILSILESDRFGIEVIPLPQRYGGQTLAKGNPGHAADLLTWRPKRGMSVVAIRPPEETDWMAGGRISDRQLAAGTPLLIVGQRTELELLRRE